MPAYLEFYTRPLANGHVEVVVVANNSEHYRIECEDQAQAETVVRDIVKTGLDQFGGVEIYSRERRN